MVALPDPALSRAILIGTSDFQRDDRLPNLPAVRNNLTDLVTALTNQRAGIISPEHCTVVDSPDSPGSFMTRLERVANQAEDLLLVYYSGHGIRHETKNILYLTVHQSNPDSPRGTAVPFDDVREVIENSPARTKLLILDCCYSGLALGSMSGGGVDQREIAISGTSVLTSSPRNKISHSPPGERNTAFTAELLSLLVKGSRIPDEPLTVNAAYRSLRSAMANRDLPLPKMKAEDTSAALLLRRSVPSASPSQQRTVRAVVASRPAAPRSAAAPPPRREPVPEMVVHSATVEPTVLEPDAVMEPRPEVPVWRSAALDTTTRSLSVASSILLWAGLVIGSGMGIGGVFGGIFGKAESGTSVAGDIGMGILFGFVGAGCGFLIRRRLKSTANTPGEGLLLAKAYPMLFTKLNKLSRTVLALATVLFAVSFFVGLFTPIGSTTSQGTSRPYSLTVQIFTLVTMAELAAISGFLFWKLRRR
ncbi:caspase domain-containing protein [Amycolatopsis sp. cg5]|uniref:caspase family protein n=1 Tax=Amycolatopsis sp. cg5 TaxID=3238802 RepID=UPI003524F0E4